jgi:hypothetical protein
MKVMGQGFYTSTGARTLNIQLFIAGSAQIATGAVTVPGATNGTWLLDCSVTTRTAGSSGTQIANCIFQMTGATLTAPGDFPMQTSSAWTVDTTATNVVDLKATWDSTTGSPTITSTNVAAWMPGGSTAGASGSFVLIEEHTASSSAALSFTTCISSTYDDYQIRFVGLVPATNGATVRMRLSSDGGSTYDSANVYGYVWFITQVAGDNNRSASPSSQSAWAIAGTTTNNTWGISGMMNMANPLGGAQPLIAWGLLEYDDSGGNGLTGGRFWWNYATAAAINAFQITASSGDLASGTVRCYGIAK